MEKEQFKGRDVISAWTFNDKELEILQKSLLNLKRES